MQKVLIRFALLIGLLLLATAPVAAEDVLAPVAQDTITDTQIITETQGVTETQAVTGGIPVQVEVQTSEVATDTVAPPAEAPPAEVAPADVVIAGPVTGASVSPQLQYGLWLVVAVVLFGVGFWLQRRNASGNKSR
jgi:hypothetical protein